MTFGEGAFGEVPYGETASSGPITGTVDGTLPTLTGSLTAGIAAVIDGHVPALTGSLVGAQDPHFAGTVPALTGTLLARRHLGTWDRSTMLGADGVHPNDVGMTFLAAVMIDALYYAGLSPAPGDTLTAYGDSWTANNTYNTPGLRAVEQLRDRFGVTLVNNAQGGYRAEDIAAWAIGTGGTFVAGTGGTVLVASVGFNDYVQTDSAQQRVATANGLRALFAALVAAERIEQTAFTYAGGWAGTNETRADGSGGSDALTTTDGASATYDITTAGDYYLLTHGVDGTTYVGGQITVTQGATTLAVIDTNQQHADTNGVYETHGYGPLAVRLSGVTTGTLTMTFNTLGRSGARGFLDALLRVDPDPPVILAVKPVRVTNVDYDFYTTVRGLIRALYDTMAAEFGPTVLVVDPAASEATISGSITALTGSLVGRVPIDGTIDGTVPTLTGSLLSIPAGQGHVDGTVPPLTGSLDTVSADAAERSRYGGRRRRAYALVAYTPPVVPPPFAPTTLRRITARAYTGTTIETDAHGVHVTINDSVRVEAPAHRHRIIVAGRDITYYRGVETPRPSYQLVAPLLYGPGSLSLPQIAVPFETPGEGALTWLHKGATVILQRCNAAGVVTATDWVGLITQFGISAGTLTATLDGEAAGRAGLDYLPPPIFRRRNDLGFWAYSIIRSLRLPFAPHLGPETGIRSYNWGGQTPLDHISELCARAYPLTGAPWTLMPRSSDGAYTFRQKDTETITASVYFDDSLAVPDLTSDLAEEPNTIYATGVTPTGLRVKGGVYPGLQQGEAPRYPFNDDRVILPGTTDSETDTGDGITVMIWKLVVTGYLDPEDRTGNYDGPVTRAIADLQEDAASGVSLVSGNMTPDTWAALYDLGVTGLSLAGSHIEPMAQWRKVRKYRRTASGNVRALNPAYDRTIPRVATAIDVGPGFNRPQIKGFAKSKLTNESGPNNWVGSVVLNGGAVISGEHNPGDPLTSADLMQAKRLRPGQNLWAPLWDGGTLFHIATVDVAPDDTVTLALDTKARDSMEVWQIIERNRETRANPARIWIDQHRKSGLTQDSVVEFDEVGGIVDDGVHCTGGAWTVFPVAAGQEGTIARLRISVNPAREFVVAVFGDRVHASRLHRLVADPLSEAGSKRWTKANVQAELDDNVLLYAAGDHDSPCGYFPGQKAQTGSTSDSDVDTTPDPITGRWQDDAGFAYRTPFGAPILWVAVYPAATCTVQPGRVMWNQIEAGV